MFGDKSPHTGVGSYRRRVEESVQPLTKIAVQIEALLRGRLRVAEAGRRSGRQTGLGLLGTAQSQMLQRRRALRHVGLRLAQFVDAETALLLVSVDLFAVTSMIVERRHQIRNVIRRDALNEPDDRFRTKFATVLVLPFRRLGSGLLVLRFCGFQTRAPNAAKDRRGRGRPGEEKEKRVRHEPGRTQTNILTRLRYSNFYLKQIGYECK